MERVSWMVGKIKIKEDETTSFRPLNLPIIGLCMAFHCIVCAGGRSYQNHTP